jgi:hypothetical protein
MLQTKARTVQGGENNGTAQQTTTVSVVETTRAGL